MEFVWACVRSARMTCVVSLLLIGVPGARAVAQGSAAPSADGATIDALIRASYEVLNGPAGTPRQWKRDSALYGPMASFVSIQVANGVPRVQVFTPEQFRRSVNTDFVTNGFFEIETARQVDQFGLIARVQSAYEARRTPTGPVIERGVNYFHLFNDGTRWWIAGMEWDSERADAPIPAALRGGDGGPPGNEDDRRAALLALERRIAQANLDCDYAFFALVEGDEFVFTDARGAVTTRAEDLAGAKSCVKRAGSFVLDDASVHLYGSTAVVTARLAMTTTGANGSPTTRTSRFTDVFAWRDGRWQLVAGHASRS